MEIHNKESFHNRMTDIFNRAYLFWHFLVILPSIILFLALVKLAIPMQLWICRFTQIYIGSLELTIIATTTIAFIVPQLSFWAIRKRKYLLFGFIISVLILDIAVIIAHASYCAWSTGKVGSFYSKSITVEQLYEECGKPLFYRIIKNSRFAIYSNGSTYYMVPLNDSGIIKQMPMGSMWND